MTFIAATAALIASQGQCTRLWLIWIDAVVSVPVSHVMVIVLLVVAAAVVGCTIESWVWLRTVPDGGESGSATVRNLGLLLAALFALPVAVWRGFAVDRQAKASQRQAETEQRSLLNSCY